VSTSLPTATPEALQEQSNKRQSKSSKARAAVDPAIDTPAISPSIPTQINESPVRPFASPASTPRPGARRLPSAATPSATTVAVRAPIRMPAQPAPKPIVASQTEGVVVPPKLIKSVRAVASLDDVRDFETGNVVLDAVVGTEGEVHLITVVSGPPSLRPAAMEAAKQYRYEPATRNGQPVPEHVHITIRFRFES
jgi:periplasmic protein TonB